MVATFASVACAQTPPPAPRPTASPAPAVIPAPAEMAHGSIAPLADPRLPRVLGAITAAERGRFDASGYADLRNHPLYGWIEYAGMRRDIDTLDRRRAEDFLKRYRGQAVAGAFREMWLAAASRREDWDAFMASWNAGVESTALRCAQLNARQALGRTDAQWLKDMEAMWRSTGKTLPESCDAPLAVFEAKGGATPALRWERIEKAAEAGQPGVMRSVARGLPPPERVLANDYADFLEGVHTRALMWPKTDRSRLIASLGLARLGKQDPDAAEAQLPRYAQALGFTDADRGRVLYQVALWTVASYLPDSARRLNAVPGVAYDERLHEWRVREAMSRSDWPAALAAIRRMGDVQRNDSRWTYFQARLTEIAGDKPAAQRLYRQAAKEAEFHGFLAADRIDQPYALCPWKPDDSAARRAAVANDPAIVRSMGLHRIDRSSWALREWDEALARLDNDGRRIAVEVAQANGWFDRAVFSLGKDARGNRRPEEMRLYHLRFPLHHDAAIRRHATTYRIDPAWVAAEIRAESVFNPAARSSANAMGLMQVLPTTGAAVARRIGRPWNGAASLYDPETNIELGTAYLRQMLDDYGNQTYFAIAGYNAGPAPLNRWKSQRPSMDPDFWIETISYKETRDYVARVLAFSVIYDWRLDGKARRVTERMHSRLDGPRKGFACPEMTASPL